MAQCVLPKEKKQQQQNPHQLLNVGQSDSDIVPCCPHAWTRVKYSHCFEVEAVRGGVWSETSCSRVSYQQEVKETAVFYM